MRDSIQNSRALLERRRELRRWSTDAEKKIWQHLRNRRMSGAKFYRQYSIGPYIADFYSQACRLVIEIDGETHDSADAKENDLVRTDYLNAHGVRVLRFTNDEVLSHKKNVLEMISEVCKNQKSPSSQEGVGGVRSGVGKVRVGGVSL